MVAVVVIVLTIAFFIVRLAPGDPAALMLGPDATPQDALELRERLGLDRPIIIQYVTFISDAVRGDLGQSIFFNQPVTQVLKARAEPTILLSLFSLTVALLVAVPIGIYSAYRRGSFFDQTAISTAMLAASVPSFWTGLMAQRWLATEYGWFPASGYGGPRRCFLIGSSISSCHLWCSVSSIQPSFCGLPGPPCWMFWVRIISEQPAPRA